MNNNVIRFAHPDKVREEAKHQACNWLARLDAGATEAELQQLQDWLRADPGHQQALLEMAELWDQLSVLDELATIFPLQQYAPAPRRWHRRGLLSTALAVMLTLAFTLDHGWLQQTPEAGMAEGAGTAPTVQLYQTLIGEQSSVVLDDGSQIILNTSTSIEVTYTPEERRIVLVSGESHFRVATDRSRPFRVQAGRSVIEATGTSFAVQHDGEESTEVMVTEGSVNFLRLDALQAAADPTLLLPLVAGDHAAYDEQSASLEKTTMAPAEMEASLSWRHGMLLFQGDPLEKVLEEISRYTSVKIEAEEAIRGIEVGGYFRAGDVDGLLMAMRDNFHIDARRISENHIVLVSQ